MTSDLNPKALAESGDERLDDRKGVQPVTPFMISKHVEDQGELPRESAEPFGIWLHQEWFDWNEDGNLTNGDVISGALQHWRGE